MADRYDVLLFLDDAKQAQISESFNLPAFDVIHALQESIRINGIAPGRYIAQTIHGDERASGWVEVRDGGALTIGPRWGLPTPIEPIDRADLGVDVGVLLSRKRTADDVLSNPEPGDRVEWGDGEVWTVTGRDTQILHDVTPPGGGWRTYGDRMSLEIWADPMDDGDGSPFTCVPHG